MILSEIVLLFVDGLQSSPGLWYAAAGIVTVTSIILYTAISSSSPRRPQPTPEPASLRTSEESKRASKMQLTNPTLPNTEQMAESTKSVEHESEPASDNDQKSPELPTSEKSETTSTAMKKPQHFLTKTQPTQRTSSYTSSSRTRKTSRTSTYRQRHITSTAVPQRNHSTRTDNLYFKPIDSSGKVKFVDIDTRFSYIDVDWGPEFIGLDPIPDLVEIDVGPSALSYELVRSPIEIKISSFLNALLTPTPRNSGTAASNDSTQPSMTADNHARQRTDNTATRQRSAHHDTWETRYSDHDRHVERRREPLTAADRRQHPGEICPQSSSSKSETHRLTTVDTTSYDSREEIGTCDGGRSRDHRSLGWEPVVDEESIKPQNVGVPDEPAIDVGINCSPLQWEPPQLNTDPFGLTDANWGFSDLEDSVVEPVEQPELEFGMFDWNPGVLIDEPVMDPESAAGILGLDGFAEPPEGAVGLPGPDAENGSNPWFPEAESFYPEEDAGDDWLMF